VGKREFSRAGYDASGLIVENDFKDFILIHQQLMDVRKLEKMNPLDVERPKLKAFP